LIGAQIGDYISRRRTSEALRESEERYRVVASTAQDAIFTIDEQSVILFCNPAVERVFGYAPAELVGRQLEIVIPERFREAHRRGMQRFLDTRTRRIPWTGVELPAVHKDGHEFPCEISFGVWESDEHTVFTGFARDITERKRIAGELQHALEDEQRARAEAEQARAQLERRAEEESSFRHLASALTGAVEMTDVLYEITTRATMVTRADGVYVERIVDASGLVEVVSTAGRGTPPRGLRVEYPGSMTEEIIERRQPVILADMDGFGPAMAPYLLDTCSNCQVLVAPLVAEQEPLGALVLLNSASSGRRFRDADVIRARTLGDLTSLALRRVRLMEQEREAKEKAEAAVRVRDETLGIVSHDLRNPLTKVALSADLLVDAPDEERADLVETIRIAARQMDRLIQDLLDVARLEAGRFSVDKSVIESEPIVRHACESHEPIAAQRKQKIVCHVEAGLPPICADRDRLLQVFGNLIGNAMKFAPERGTVHVEAVKRGTCIEFRVRDSGPGIPEADLKHVFRAYWQAKKTAHMGAGLGLAIVRGIVEAHGGKVWAENATGGGAMFTFTIPTA
ncbi:MAG TPA: PAS domain S-box protein, partial [Thermoanaerobaculia bacterium]